MSGIVQTEKRKDVIVTDIYSGDSDRKAIGWLESRHKLTDDNVEVVTFHFEDAYKPEKLSGGDMFTKYKDSFDGHTEVLFPNVAIIVSGVNDLTMMMNGVIQQITPIKHGGNKFEAIVTIDTPSTEEGVFERMKIRIPAGINLHKKIIQIVQYDIFLTIGNTQKLEMLWGNRTIINDDQDPEESSPIKVVFESGERQVEPLYYKLNGMPITKVKVRYRKGMASSKISVYFSSDTDALSTTCTVDEFTQMSETFYYSWRGIDTVNIYVDTDKKRLAAADTTVVCDIAAEALIAQLREELLTSSQKIAEIEIKLTKANNIIASQEEKLKQEELKTEKERISYETSKVAADEKLNQEQHKTKREEISYHSSRDDASSDVVIGSLKVAGAVIGFGTLLFAILKKSPSSSGMVEWGLPVFGLAKPAIMAGIGYTMYKAIVATGVSAAVGGVACSIASGVGSAAAGVASFIADGASKACEKIGEAYDYVAEKAAPVVTKIKEIASSVVSGAVKVCKKVVDVACNVGRSVASTAKQFWDWLW